MLDLTDPHQCLSSISATQSLNHTDEMANDFLNLPHEVLHCILTYVDPHDIARLSCCRTLHAFIRSDRLLFKELYLNHFVGF